MTIIKNKPHDLKSYRRQFSFSDNARSAWSQILKYYQEKNPDLVVLLPAYIGYSVNEGSGIFDPIREHKINFEFYGLSKDLQIDFEDLKQRAASNKKNILVLLVHYFGFPDKNYDGICDWLELEQIPFTEDCAHAMLSDLIGDSCGRRGRFSFQSIHKMLPFDYGGLLLMNDEELVIDENHYPKSEPINIFGFDLKKIYDKRCANYSYLANLLKDYKGVHLLYPELPNGVGPQTLPILVEGDNRDDIYFKMNDLGFGFVSLYHTMINDLKSTEFDSANYTSRHITNLPIHQDCSEDQLKAMANSFKNILDGR